jgi:hypothetical protein
LAFAAFFADLACFGAAVAGLPPPRLWIAFQIRLTASFRFVNFLTGVRPGYTVPDLDQPVAGPLGSEIHQLLLAGEYFALEICLVAA